MSKFTAAQIAKIRSLRDAGPIDGNYSHIYHYIDSVLPPGSKEQRWFAGAAQANAGQGVYSVFIREYSKLQMELRGVKYTDALMQQASNEVAVRAFRDILGEFPVTEEDRQPDASGNVTAPTIVQIASADAIGVGITLFESIPNDSAIKDNQNSGWAGAVLFSALGSDHGSVIYKQKSAYHKRTTIVTDYSTDTTFIQEPLAASPVGQIDCRSWNAVRITPLAKTIERTHSPCFA